jgi:hypothetical protein
MYNHRTGTYFILGEGKKYLVSVSLYSYPVIRGESLTVCKVVLAAYPVLRVGICGAVCTLPSSFVAWRLTP